MPMYRTRYPEIEARQLSPDNLEQIEAWCGGSVKGILLPRKQRVIDIQTPDGEMRADVGDYIVKDSKGGFYPCKPDIFEATYDLIERRVGLRLIGPTGRKPKEQ